MPYDYSEDTLIKHTVVGLFRELKWEIKSQKPEAARDDLLRRLMSGVIAVGGLLRVKIFTFFLKINNFNF